MKGDQSSNLRDFRKCQATRNLYASSTPAVSDSLPVLFVSLVLNLSCYSKACCVCEAKRHVEEQW